VSVREKLAEALRDLASAALASAAADRTDYGSPKRTQKIRRRMLVRLQQAARTYHEVTVAAAGLALR
jgi:hypothetical protein